MSNIAIFKTEEEFDIFKQSKSIKLIGKGREGECYESDGIAYKFITNPTKLETTGVDYKKIITTEDIDLPSFAFPERLYVVGDKLKGYETSLVRDNIFSDNNVQYNLKMNLSSLDMEKLAIAYRKMMVDMCILNAERIKIYDMVNNILFNGKSLCGIDTIYYYKSLSHVKEHNLAELNRSIERQFILCVDKSLRGELPNIENMGIDDYLSKVEKVLRKNKKRGYVTL